MDDEKLIRIIPIIRERLVTLDDALTFAGFFFKDSISPDPGELIGKKMSAAESAGIARRTYEVLSELTELSCELVEPPLRNLVGELGYKSGQFFGILRVAVTGQVISPPLFESMAIIGKEKVLERILKAIIILEKMVGNNLSSSG